MVSLLETQTWPTENINEFGDKEIIKIANQFRDLLSKNGCKLNVINEKWQFLKCFIVPLINNNKYSAYLELWKRVFLNIKTQKKNVIMVAHIQIITCHSFYKCQIGQNVFKNVACENRLEKLINNW